ncbi:MAG: glutamate synthase subunit alpha, partial [Acidimicrobiia bacterium]
MDGSTSFANRRERDACGIGFVANSEGIATRQITDLAIDALCRVRHRGAVAADAKTGDGAGLLLPIPGRFYAEWLSSTGSGETSKIDSAFLGIAMPFVWDQTGSHRTLIEAACRSEGIDVVAWREVPTDLDALGEYAARTAPVIEQAILLKPMGVTQDEAERRAVRARKRSEKSCADAGIKAFFPSFSFHTLTYKALCAADQLTSFYRDLTEPLFEAPFVIFHQRFATNTRPTWERAQPFRMLCHNGEINTIQGNINRMKAREGRLGKTNLL